jgi:hypothetical protein
VLIRGLRDSEPTTWYRIDLPVGRTGALAYVKSNRALRLRVDDIAKDQTRLLPRTLRDQIANGTVQLESLLSLRANAKLQVVATAAHSYTLGRTIAVREFDLDSIRRGPFEENGDRVLECASTTEKPKQTEHHGRNAERV